MENVRETQLPDDSEDLQATGKLAMCLMSGWVMMCTLLKFLTHYECWCPYITDGGSKLNKSTAIERTGPQARAAVQTPSACHQGGVASVPPALHGPRVTEPQVGEGFGSSEEELELVKAAALEKMGEHMDKMLEWDLNLIPVLPVGLFGHPEISDLNILRL